MFTMKAEANAIAHQRRRRIKELETQKLDSLAKRIEEHKGGSRMFAAIKALKEIDAPKVPITVHDTTGNVVHDEQEAASKIADNFHQQFSAKNVTPLPMFEGPPRPLH